MSENRILPKLLEIDCIRLEPHAEAHREGLRQAAHNDAALFAYMPADLSGKGFDRWFDWTTGISDGKREMAWTVTDGQTGRIVGSTRYLNIELPHKRVEIGHTWYTRDAWGSLTNPSCKYLLLQFGFEELALNRIELKCDARNKRSCAAILKLGAREEGTLRSHMVMSDGYVRDTIYFSVLKAEWPLVKQSLLRRIYEDVSPGN
ncbi:MAG: GNAT family protein [Micropepsaceae bacterium]